MLSPRARGKLFWEIKTFNAKGRLQTSRDEFKAASLWLFQSIIVERFRIGIQAGPDVDEAQHV